MSTGPFSKYMLNLSLTVESVYMSTGTFPKDIVGLRFDRGICLHVYRHIFEVYVEFEFDRGFCLHVYRLIFEAYSRFETAVRLVYMSTGTFPKDIVRFSFDRGICLHVYRHFSEGYSWFEI